MLLKIYILNLGQCILRSKSENVSTFIIRIVCIGKIFCRLGKLVSIIKIK